MGVAQAALQSLLQVVEEIATRAEGRSDQGQSYVWFMRRYLVTRLHYIASRVANTLVQVTDGSVSNLKESEPQRFRVYGI